jgi:hypothetical protein
MTDQPTPKSGTLVPMTQRTQPHVERRYTGAGLQLLSATLANAPTKPEHIAFLIKQLIFCVMPHSQVQGDIYQKRSGGLTLTIQAGVDETGESYGVPYGAVARHAMIYIITQAQKTGSRKIYLGESFADFMRSIGYSAHRSGGKRSARINVRRQLDAVAHQRLRVSTSSPVGQGTRDRGSYVTVAEDYDVWWTEHADNEPVLFKSYIILSERFFDLISENPVPLDLRIVKALHKDALALDLYAWATLTSFRTADSGKPHSVAWKLLHEQFGDGYTGPKGLDNFTQKAKAAFTKLKQLYHGLDFRYVRGGIEITAKSRPSIPTSPTFSRQLPQDEKR